MAEIPIAVVRLKYTWPEFWRVFALGFALGFLLGWLS